MTASAGLKPYPLTSPQRGIWLHQALYPQTPLYNIGGYVEIRAALDVSLFECAINRLVEEHDNLRTILIAPQDANAFPAQAYLEKLQVKVALRDYSQQSAPNAVALKWMTARFAEPFELYGSPLFRFDLVKSGETTFYWLMQYHHLIADGWTVALLNRSLAHIYTRLAAAEELAISGHSYVTFVENDLAYARSAEFAGHRKYWLARYDPPPAPLVTQYPIVVRQTVGSACEQVSVPRSLFQRLREFAKARGTTPFRVLLSALYVYFTRTAERTEFVVGIPMLNRTTSEARRTAGLFASVSPARLDFGTRLAFDELVLKIDESLKRDSHYQRFPIEEITRALATEPRLHSSLYDVSFSYQRFDYDSTFAGIETHTTWLFNGWEQTPLAIFVQDFHAQCDVKIDFSYNLAYFTAEDIRAIQARWLNTLEAALNNGSAGIQDLPVMGAQEHQLLAQWSAARASYLPQDTLVSLFEQQVDRSRDQIAVTFEDQTLTYEQLNAYANKVAHHLLGMQSDVGTRLIQPNTLVALCVDRSLEMVIGILGILKAGAAYVPIDPDYPTERCAFMLTDSAVPILLARKSPQIQEAIARTGYAGEIVYLEEVDSSRPRDTNPTLQSSPESLAYLIYTSGSTGRPKGCRITHYNVSRLFKATEELFQFHAADVWTLFHSYAFDFSVWELWGALLHGAKLVVVPYWVSRSPGELHRLLRQEKVTILNQTPSAFRSLMQADENQLKGTLSLRYVIFGGESLHGAELHPWFHKHGYTEPQLVNMYGITETTVHVTYFPFTPSSPTDRNIIGRPLPDLRVYVLDENRQAMPVGISGEIYVAGAGLSAGYLNRPELDMERFIELETLGCVNHAYRTGDRARWLPDGQLEYLGRVDRQVKIRGFRIELGEIETVLCEHGAVRQAAVILHGTDNDKHLAGYVKVGKEASADVANALREYLKQRVPFYMVPAYIQVLETWPLTVHGKLDHAALPARKPTDDVEPGVTPTERLLAEIWEAVLQRRPIGRHDNFFDLGGDSIRAIRVAGRVKQAGKEVNVRDIYANPTVAALARTITVQERPTCRTAPFDLVRAEVRQHFPEGVEDAYPLSALQSGMFFHGAFDGAGAMYHDVFTYHVNVPFSETLLQASFQGMSDLHPVLRTSFHFEELTGPLQWVHRSAQVPLQVEDLREWAPPAQEAHIEAWIDQEKYRPFDWAQAPLLRVRVHRRSESTLNLTLSFHHAILDGWSVASLITEVLLDYASRIGCRPPPVHEAFGVCYRDFILLEHEATMNEATQQFWRRYLDGQVACRLPRMYRHDRPHKPQWNLEILIPTRLSDAIKALARALTVPVKAVLLAGYLRVLGLFCGRSDILTGLVVNGRPEETGGDKMLGLFLNSVPLRQLIAVDATWRSVVLQVFETERAIAPHRRYPLAEMQRRMNLPPLDTLFNFIHFHVYRSIQEQAGLEILSAHHFEQTNFALVCNATLAADTEEIRLSLTGDPEALGEHQLTQFGAYYLRALSDMTERPDEKVLAAHLLSDADARDLKTWNDTEVRYPHHATLISLFEAQVERSRDRIAAVFEGQSLSYEQLNTRANQVAHHLLGLTAKNGMRLIRPDTLVAICMDRSPEMLIGLLGILKAGAAYVPIDPDYPAERRAFMLEDSAAPALFTLERLQARMSFADRAYDGEVICLDHIDWDQLDSTNPALQATSEALAYMIYTSGSTGRPKGAMNVHAGIVNRLLWMQEQYGLSPTDAVLQKTPLSFDVSVWEFFWPLLQGARLILARPGGHKEPAYLLELIETSAITTVHFVPSMLQLFIESADMHRCSNLKRVLCSGEALSPTLQASFFAKFPDRVELNNLYGPTEAAIDVSYWACEANDTRATVPIGRPVANTRLFVVDSRHEPVPIGVPGELCIGGRQVGGGYWNRPDLTAERFVELDLFGRRERVYKTGDLARWLPEGCLEFLGRLDHQVKLRGFRIELGEIEALLLEHAAVREAVVTLFESQGTPRLVAYLVLKGVSGPSSTGACVDFPPIVRAQMLAFLRARLPEYMVPSQLQVLQSLPVGHGGKIDRNALPPPEQEEVDYQLPRNELERQLGGLWSDLLRRPDIGVHDNFFALGGDSILSIQIVARARRLGIEIRPRDLFEHPTLAELAAVSRPGTAGPEQGEVLGEAPLTPIQREFLFFCQANPAHFNQSVLLRVSAEVHEHALQSALEAILSHHDAFQLRYSYSAGQWHQHFAGRSTRTPFHSVDLRDLPILAQTAELEARIRRYQESLDLTAGPLTRLVLLYLSDGLRLFWCVHHLLVDGVSWHILLEDLSTAYRQAVARQPSSLPAKTSSFKLWADRLAAYARTAAATADKPTWQAIRRQHLPVDYPGGQNRLEQIRRHTMSWDVDFTQRLLEDSPAAYRTRANEILLTALTLTLCEWSGEPGCVVDVEGHGRTSLFADLDLSRTVGWFTAIYPVALTLPEPTGKPQADLARALQTVKEELRGVAHDGVGYGVLTQLCGETLPHGEILFNYLGQLDPAVAGTVFEFASEDPANNIAERGPRRHLIDIDGSVRRGMLHLTWSYSGGCYRQQTIAALAARFATHLDSLVSHCCSGARGITPSDVALADMSQDALDELQAHHPGLQDLYPLGPMQQGMLFQKLYEPEPGVNFQQLHLDLSHLDPLAFKAAWQSVWQRHAVLRSAFVSDLEVPLQMVLANAPPPWTEHDWRDVPADEQSDGLKNLLRQERQRGFELLPAPLARFDLIRLTDSRYALLWHYHHILIDGWCLPVLLREVRHYYLASCHGKLSTLPSILPYRAYISWLRQQNIGTASAYWSKRLADFQAPTAIPPLQRRTHLRDSREVIHPLQESVYQRLRTFCRAHRLTLNTVIQGAWALLLSRYSRDADICFGVTVSGRNVPLAGIDQMIGLFINTLPLRVEIRKEDTLEDWLQRLQRLHQDDQEYAYLPLHEIQTLGAATHGTALFDSLLVLENYPVERHTETADGYRIEDSRYIEYTTYPLTVFVIPGDTLRFRFGYDASRLDAADIEHIWRHLEKLLDGMTADSTRPVHLVQIVTEEEQTQLQAWNRTVTHYPPDETVVSLFEHQVAAEPQKIAVKMDEQSLTYAMLSQRVNQLANYLLGLQASDGRLLVGPGTLVAIATERSVDMIVGLLAILKAGAAYLPVDPEFPPDRIAFMLRDSAARVLLTRSDINHERFVGQIERTVVNLDSPEVAAHPVTDPGVLCGPGNLAHAIYTSGSTGKPKGVTIEHRSLTNLLRDMQQRTAASPTDTLLAVTTLSFDIAALELYLPLVTGGTLILASRETARDGAALREMLDRHPVTLMQATPATWNLLRQVGWCARRPIRILCGGEALADDLAIFLHQNAQRAWNVYGPTETTIWSTANELTSFSHESRSIGRPIANTRVYILDPFDQPVPTGIPGELCIAGDGVGRGYLGSPELTARKFITVDLFGRRERVYKTGDLARWLSDGQVEFLGRLDEQIKLRGFRIEPGEIEASLVEHAAVAQAVVVLAQSETTAQLVAFVVLHCDTQSGGPVDAHSLEITPNSELREFLSARLPDYMIPAQIRVLARLPLTPAGKVDRKALSTTLLESGRPPTTMPRDALELRITHLWEKVLNVRSPGIYDNFFELGGHSLLAVRLASSILQDLDYRIPVGVLFANPTIASLAHIVRSGHPDIKPGPLIPLQPGGDGPPVYCLPGAMGSVLYLYPLASHLGKAQPCYGLPTPALNGTPSIADFAAFHVGNLLERQPEGPYRLVGHSSGAYIAFEMAWQLEQRGETVALLAILDANAPGADPTAHLEQTLESYTELRWLYDMVWPFEDVIGITWSQLTQQRDLGTAYELVMQAFQQHEIFFTPGTPLEELRQMVNVMRHTIVALRNYRIPGQVKCPIDLFQADDHLDRRIQDSREAWGWPACTTASVEITRVAGRHESIMTEPHVQQLGVKLAGRLTAELPSPPSRRASA